jgi:hypothetical protein
MSSIFPVFTEYFKHVPEFINILMEDKVRLVKNHFGMMININEVLMYRVTPRNHIITWANVFGVDIRN